MLALHHRHAGTLLLVGTVAILAYYWFFQKKKRCFMLRARLLAMMFDDGVGHLQQIAGFGNLRGMHSGVGSMQSRIPFPLHLTLAQDPSSVSTRQS